jgi:hypothetical protein
MSEKLYKVLGNNGNSCNGGRGKWSLPTKTGRPGHWMPPIEGHLIPCENGYHLCREADLIHWLGPTIYEAEYRGDRVDGDNKIVVREARLLYRFGAWNEKTARLFACDCASWALTLIEKPDARSVEAVRVARLFAVGEANQEQLAAAWAAAGDAAGAAARGAARAAAWDAARGVAWDAAWDAARGAARAAAGAAAGDAAGAAAGDAAGAAAGDAAGAAAYSWMTERLFQYIRDEVA